MMLMMLGMVKLEWNLVVYICMSMVLFSSLDLLINFVIFWISFIN